MKQANQAIPAQITQPVNIRHAEITPPKILEPEEYENLKRQIQLFRISQLRYIVQKYSLPANGNKTRLVQLILYLFEAMRNTPLLSQIYADVLEIVSSFHEPFANPLDKMHKLSLNVPESHKNVVFQSPPHPFIKFPENSTVFIGPLFASPGASGSCHEFLLPSQPCRILIDFAWPNGSPLSFELIGEVNGFPINISIDDPVPLPIDITDMCTPNQKVVVDIKSLRTQSIMALSVRQYELVSIKDIAISILKVDPSYFDHFSNTMLVKGKSCQHNDGFLVLPFLAENIIKKNNLCPICKNQIQIEDLVIALPNPSDNVNINPTPKPQNIPK